MHRETPMIIILLNTVSLPFDDDILYTDNCVATIILWSLSPSGQTKLIYTLLSMLFLKSMWAGGHFSFFINGFGTV